MNGRGNSIPNRTIGHEFSIAFRPPSAVLSIRCYPDRSVIPRKYATYTPPLYRFKIVLLVTVMTETILSINFLTVG